MLVTLTKPIKPGYRRPITIRPDAPVDVLEGGGYAKATVLQGDSTAVIREESTATEIKAFINGDGSLGTKLVQIEVDGALGERKVSLTLDIAFEVAHPDATSLVLEEGEDEVIPA